MKLANHVRLLATVACLITWNVGAAEAAFMTVDAVLDHTDLSDTNPINWSLQFQPVLTEIHSVTLDTYWIGDGLGPGEGVTFWGVEGAGSGGGGSIPLDGPTIFFHTLTFPGSYPGVFDHFLDGSAQGQITTYDLFPPIRTTATFDRLVFTFDDGVPVPPAPTPEPGSLLLLATGILAGARKLQRHRRA